MKKGDFVRRQLSNGSIIGPFMQVMHVSGNTVYCDVIGSDEPNIRYLKSQLKVLTHAQLPVSEQILMDLKNGKQFKVRHPVCETWKRVHEKNPKLITFYCIPKMLKYTFTVDDIHYTPTSTGLNITIVISNKIL